MKHLYYIIAFVFLAIIGLGKSLAQERQSNELPHSHPELEKKLDELKESNENANKTFEMAQETYKSMDSREKTFFTTIQIFIAIMSLSVTLLGLLGIGTHYYNNYLNRKKIEEFSSKAKDEIEKGKKEIIETHKVELTKLVDGKEDAIRRMIQAKELDYRLRDESKIIVIKNIKTPIPESFYKVLNLFKQFDKNKDLIKATNLSEVLTKDNIKKIKNYDLVIIENLADEGQWKIGNQTVLDEDVKNEIKMINEDMEDDIEAFARNQAFIIKLANEICIDSCLIYYGSGLLKSNLIEQSNQLLFAFAQAPSTLYSNMMNLLKFKDVINRV